MLFLKSERLLNLYPQFHNHISTATECTWKMRERPKAKVWGVVEETRVNKRQLRDSGKDNDDANSS